MLRSRHPVPRRRGNILIVTLLLLALFATIGLTIVYYTKDLSERQRINIEAANNGAQSFTDDGTTAFNEFLNNLIYDAPVPANGTYPTSSLWGHSLMRTMYGGVATPGVAGPNYPATATVPWNGPGTFHDTITAQGTTLDSGQVMNYEQLWLHGGKRYPEITAQGEYAPKNAPYTYPDLKDFYLASFVPATGEVLSPSYYRMYNFMSQQQAATTNGLPATGLEPPGSTNPNTNWTNIAGKFLTVRPRPIDNIDPNSGISAFPYPPANADGTYTGDVQNLSGSYVYNPVLGQYVAHNDSIWIDAGIAPMTLPNGKTVKPLIAPLIIDLDALFNYNVHGNQFNSSGAGIGPWEVNMSRAIGGDATSLINGRGTPLNKAGTGSKAYNAQVNANSQALPYYSYVPWWTGGGAAPPTQPGKPGSLNLPGAGLPAPIQSSLATAPAYNPAQMTSSSGGSAGLQGYDNSSTPLMGHNAVFNPAEWPLLGTVPSSTSATPQPYPTADLQYLLAQYCAPPSQYAVPTAIPPSSLNLNTVNATSIRGTQAASPNVFPTVPHPVQPTNPYVQFSPNTDYNGYRVDPANNNRALFTPYSFGLDRPGLSPNFYNLAPRGKGLPPLQFTATDMAKGPVLSNTTTAFPTTFRANELTDFGNPRQLANARAALGPVDLNRPLADYRLNTGLPLSASNMNTAVVPFGKSTATQAVIDRQQFAMSIFVRLVVATGADASYTTLPNIGETISFPFGPPSDANPATKPSFQALRELAQIAANIVDYIDSDDVSTAFVWNPIDPTDPLNGTNFNQNVISEHVVFGVEKPRLVLNEAYAEIVNDWTDPTFQGGPRPPQAGHPPYNPVINFWLELVNPSSNVSNPSSKTTSPLSDGTVTVLNPAGNGIPAFNSYQVVIARNSLYKGQSGGLGGANFTGIADLLRDPLNANNPGNVTGSFTQFGVLPDIVFNFQATANGQPPTQPIAVGPANGSATTPNSVLLLAPFMSTPQQANGGAQPPNFVYPTGKTNTSGIVPFQAANGTPQQALIGTDPHKGGQTVMSYRTVPMNTALPQDGAKGVEPDLQNHVVLLQRLANPYLPPSPANPFITVDYMDYIPAADRVQRAFNERRDRQPVGQGQQGGGKQEPGYNPSPASLGRVQPYANWTSIIANPPMPPYTPVPPSTAGGTYSFNFPSSLVVPQQPIPPTSTAPTGSSSVSHSFGMFNYTNTAAAPNPSTYLPSPMNKGKASLSGDTLMTPFDWITHLDRTLINQTELLHVTTGRPYEFTMRSIAPNTPNGVNATDVTKFGNTLGAAMLAGGNSLYRALDVLRITPYGQMTALGGRVPGKVNINTIQDKRVWDAVFDPQLAYNSFTITDVTNMWYPSTPPKTPATTLLTTRTRSLTAKYSLSYPTSGNPTAPNQLTDTSGLPYQTPVPGPSVYDTTVVNSAAGPIKGTDRPFLPFGAPSFTNGGLAFSSGSGLFSDTLLRNGGAGPAQSPFIFTASNSGVGSPPYDYSTSLSNYVAHPYVQAEALRKITNSTTTVSHTFAVWVTVGYFDYNRTGNNNASKPVLGAEYYNIVPGDLRRKFFAVVDRSMVGLDPGSVYLFQQNPTTPPTQSPNLPVFTTVGGTAGIPAGSTSILVTTSSLDTVYSSVGQYPTGGQPSSTSLVNQTPGGGGYIAIGTGATQEIVQVTNAQPYPNAKNPVAGLTQYTLVTPITGKPYQLKYPHFPGELISNVIPGNPGPQVASSAQIGLNNVTRVQRQVQVGNFNFNQAPYNFVIPFWAKLQ
jgi:hypothetical protein